MRTIRFLPRSALRRSSLILLECSILVMVAMATAPSRCCCLCCSRCRAARRCALLRVRCVECRYMSQLSSNNHD
eukprot:1249070-Pleurochrysis_carterae.AAC.2